MARPSALATVSISQLERLLDMRQDRLKELSRQRSRIQGQLEKLDAEITKLSGRGNGSVNGHSRRPRNGVSLVATLEAVLSGAKPMSVGEIVEAVQKRDYTSKSTNFRGIVNQTLVKEKQFASAARGVYQLKK